MSCNLKALGLVLVAVFALGAVAASSASAEAVGNFHSHSERAIWTGEQSGENVFRFTDEGEPAPTFGCPTSTVEGTVESEEGEGAYTTTEATVHPVIGNEETTCSLGMFGKAKIETAGCNYVFGAHTDEDEHAALSIECEAEQAIKIKFPLGCVITIPEQGPVFGLHYENEGETEEGSISIYVTLRGITYTSTMACPVFGIPTQGEELDYEGEFTVEAYEDQGVEEGTRTGIWWEVAGEAPPAYFYSETAETTLIGEATEPERFIVKAGTAECSESVYKGELASSPAATITLSPEYGSCEAFGFSSAEIAVNGCSYSLAAGEDLGLRIEGSASVVCPEGKAIEIVAKVLGLVKCTVTIGAQSGLTEVTYPNAGAGSSRDFKVAFGLGGLKYSQEPGEGLGKCEAGSFKNGIVSGAPTVIGENAEKEQVGVWVE